METRQYAIGDVITMQLMRREKGVLIALPKSQWMNVVQPVYIGGECTWALVFAILLWLGLVQRGFTGAMPGCQLQINQTAGLVF